MRLFRSFAPLAVAALLSTPGLLHGQSSDLPSAPAALPSAPAAPAAPAKPVFQLPLGTPTTVAPKAAPADEDTLCYAAAVGLYAKHKPFSPAQEEAVSRYMSVTIHQLEIEWGRHMPRVANDAWVKSATVVVRFAVMPDGTIDTPIVTASSGRKSYDDHALNAIQASTPFPPLPDGVTRAVPVCMRFGYNTDRSPKKFEPAELWPAPAKPAAPVNPSGSQPK